MIGLSEGRGVNIVYSWETLGKSELLIALIPLICLQIKTVVLLYHFPIRVLFCFREKQNNPAEGYREKNKFEYVTGTFITVLLR